MFLVVVLVYLILCIAMMLGALVTSSWWLWALAAGWGILAGYWLQRWRKSAAIQ